MNINEIRKKLMKLKQEVTDLWKAGCDKFIDILKEHFPAKNVYLIKQYVHSNMRDYDCSCGEREMNTVLYEYYRYFEENFPEINCMNI